MKKDLQKYLEDSKVQEKLEFLKSRFDAFGRMFKRKHYALPDDLFFAIEDLPLIGKEYWFLHFCVPGSKDQAIITFGRALDKVRVNRTNVDKITKKSVNLKLNEIPCASVVWLYDSKRGKRVVLDSEVSLSIEGGDGAKTLEAKKGKSHAKVCGKYPNYRVSLVKNSKNIFDAKVKKPSGAKTPFEIIRMFAQPIAPGLEAAMVNYYFDFEGKMNGRKISGSAYLQKVVAAIPLAPWNWVRMHFEDGTVLDFFAGKPLGDPKIKVACVAYLEHGGKRVKLECPELEFMGDGEKRSWILRGVDFLLCMKSYSVQRFKMSNKTEFIYDEFLVTATDFVAKFEKKTITIDDTGAGSGIVEEASGYLI